MLLLCLVLAAGFFPFTPALADEESPATGQFGSSAPPQVDAINITAVADGGIPASLNPAQEYDISVTVSDADGIGQLEKLTVKLWYDPSGTAFTSEAFSSQGIFDPQTLMTVEWTRADNSVYVPANGSWRAYGLSLPTSGQLANPGYTSHTFYFRIKIGKVAQETTGGKWQVAAKLSDSVPYSDYDYYQAGGQAGLPMNWYGEVSLAGSDFIDWGYIANGLRAGQSGSIAAVTVSGDGVYFLSNGDFQQMVKASTTWYKVGDASETVQLSADATESNTFALRVSNKKAADLSAAIVLPADGSYATIDASGQATGESGIYEKNYHIWLALSPEVSANGLYRGSITFSIANR